MTPEILHLESLLSSLPSAIVDMLPEIGPEMVPEVVKVQLRILLGFIAALWTVELVDSLLLGNRLNRYGIRPRRLRGLGGVVIAPLLHGDLAHLAANTIPFMVLGWFIMVRYLPDFFIVTAIVWICSGLGIWLIAPSKTNHIGASGLVFGYFGFLLLQGYFERSLVAIALAVLSGLLYGGSIWGLLPIRKGRSWQGHLFGFLAGGWAARYIIELRDWIQPLITP